MSENSINTVEKSDEPWRFRNGSLMSFAEKVYIKCPKCARAAVIKAEYKSFMQIENARLQCLNCTFYEDWDPEKLYGPVVGKGRQPCPNCGTQWLTAEAKADNTKYQKDYTEATCHVCKKTSYLSLFWHSDYRDNKPLDPAFHNPLWLQTECAENILWAYNEKHLAYVKSYIEADLREDDGRTKRSLISNLPKWMTSAKNRKAVLKAIAKLENLFEEISV